MLSYKYDKKRKINSKILDEKDIAYEEAEKVLIDLGYVKQSPSGGSSHVTFRKSSSEKITLVKTQNPVKRYLIKQIKDIIK